MIERQPGANVPPNMQVVSGGVPVTPIATAPAITPLRDRIHWGPVWGGLMTALTSFLVMQLFFYWIGVLGFSATTGGLVANSANAWLPPILALVAFFLGGWLAGGSLRMRDTSLGVLNGFMVWALGIVLILAFSTFTASMAFGTLGQVFGRGGMGGIPSGAANTLSLNAAAGWGLLFMILSACAATLGGWLGGTTATTDVAVNP